MCVLVSIILLVSWLFVKDNGLLIASGLFAIAMAIEEVAVNSKKN